MDITLLETNLNSVTDLDIFESLIWTDRYYGFGEFELVTPVTDELVNFLKEDRYLSIKNSEHTMIIEGVRVSSDVEEGNKIIVEGRSLESILERRIVLAKTILTGSFQEAIERLLNENAINPTIEERKITRLEFEASDDETITSLQIDRQFEKEILYDVISYLCIAYGVGFKITITDDGKFLFKLYAGKDRSYAQLPNPYVVFSPKFENIIYGEYIETNKFLKTVAYVSGEVGIGSDRLSIIVEKDGGGGSDLDRREVFIDASNISRNVEGTSLTDEEYQVKLTEKGKEDLSQMIAIQTFEGQIDASTTYVYGEDFFMGDVVQVANEYGHEAKSRVIEFINSEDPSGIKIYPTFSTLV